jgi:WD40 repeat protein
MIQERMMTDETVFEIRSITSLALSEDESRVALAYVDTADTVYKLENMRLSIVQLSTGQEQLSISIPEHFTIDGLWWRANDTEVVVIYENRIERYAAQTGVRLSQSIRPYYYIFKLGLHPDRATIALLTKRRTPAFDAYLEIVDVVTGTQRYSMILPIPYEKKTDWIAWSRDGNRLAILSQTGKALIYNWNGSTLTLVREFVYAVPDWPTDGAWSPDNQQLAITVNSAGTGLGLSVYDVNTGTFLRQLTNIRIEDIQWSPETNLIAGIVWQSMDPSYLRVLNSTTGATVQDFTSLNPDLSRFSWSRNGNLVLGYNIEYEDWVQNPNSPLVTTQRPSILP